MGGLLTATFLAANSLVTGNDLTDIIMRSSQPLEETLVINDQKDHRGSYFISSVNFSS